MAHLTAAILFALLSGVGAAAADEFDREERTVIDAALRDSELAGARVQKRAR